MHNLVDNIRIRFKVFTDINTPDVYTATGLFSSANWMERETYDFFGVNFVGHPNLKRILMWMKWIISQCEKNFHWKIRQGLIKMMKCLEEGTLDMEQKQIMVIFG